MTFSFEEKLMHNFGLEYAAGWNAKWQLCCAVVAFMQASLHQICLIFGVWDGVHDVVCCPTCAGIRTRGQCKSRSYLTLMLTLIILVIKTLKYLDSKNSKKQYVFPFGPYQRRAAIHIRKLLPGIIIVLSV